MTYKYTRTVQFAEFLCQRYFLVILLPFIIKINFKTFIRAFSHSTYSLNGINGIFVHHSKHSHETHSKYQCEIKLIFQFGCVIGQSLSYHSNISNVINLNFKQINWWNRNNKNNSHNQAVAMATTTKKTIARRLLIWFGCVNANINLWWMCTGIQL